MSRGNKKLILRLAFTIGFLAIIIPRVELSQVYKVISSINLPYFYFFLIAIMADRWLMAFKWNVLLEMKGVHISDLYCLKLYMIGGLFGEFLPTGLGVDLYRIQSLVRSGTLLKDVTASVVVERTLGFFSTVVLAFIAMGTVAIFYNRSLIPYVYPLFFLFLIVLALFMLLMHSSKMDYASKFFRKFHSNLLLEKIQSLYEATMEFKSKPSIIWYFFWLSMIEQVVTAVLFYIGALALGFNIELIYFIALIPAIFILLKFPISIQGIGVQEGLFMFFFSLVGMHSTDAFSLALLMRVGRCMLLFSIGGILYVTS